LYAQGRYDEASTWAGRAESTAADDDLDARLAWEPVRAKLLARDGEHDRALRAAHAVATAAESTDALNQRARVLLDLADVLRLAGQDEKVQELTERAKQLYEQKGNLAGAVAWAGGRST